MYLVASDGEGSRALCKGQGCTDRRRVKRVNSKKSESSSVEIWAGGMPLYVTMSKIIECELLLQSLAVM
jgi:hypothetical protein